ncbi:sigma-70 region 4 domain-containing protein [Streptomyces sp. 769]|uniref:sigma-70 region 4 domain-containing protein n=1 Tax=Streptomyces sp. 769 TaxID=1262452 RepID=UPI0006903874|nr:sigma-70 region 4 domain-containing protein [Streptomyces sp. 769]
MTTSRLRSQLPATTARCRPTGFRLAYTAFRQLHHDIYLRYASVRTEDWNRANQCVDAVFEELSTGWPAALRSNCPAARAWFLLRQEAAVRARCRPGQTWRIHCLLEESQADVVLLHIRLGLPVAEVAALMGVDDCAVRALLRAAERSLQAIPACVSLWTFTPPGQATVARHTLV